MAEVGQSGATAVGVAEGSNVSSESENATDPCSESPTQEERSIDAARRRIAALVSIAATNGSSMSSEELSSLLPEGTFESQDDLEEFVFNDLILGQDLTIRGGEIAPRAHEDLTAHRTEQRLLSQARIAVAERFVKLITRICPGVRLVAISGSTAYAGADPSHDLDFFLVSRRRRLWVGLFAAMLVARILRMRNRALPSFCFNLVMDDTECENAFRSQQDPLFAREALSVKVVRGSGYYRSLLETARWMSSFFPGLYDVRLKVLQGVKEESDLAGNPAWSVVNLLGFATLAPYLWLVGLVRNARLGRSGATDKLFRTVVRPSYCAFESVRYERLREHYLRAF